MQTNAMNVMNVMERNLMGKTEDEAILILEAKDPDPNNGRD